MLHQEKTPSPSQHRARAGKGMHRIPGLKKPEPIGNV